MAVLLPEGECTPGLCHLVVTLRKRIRHVKQQEGMPLLGRCDAKHAVSIFTAGCTRDSCIPVVLQLRRCYTHTTTPQCPVNTCICIGQEQLQHPRSRSTLHCYAHAPR